MLHKEPTIGKETTSGTISQAVSEPTRQNQTKTVPVQPSEKETSRSDNVAMVQSLATVPKEPEKATGSDSTSGKISKAVPESTGQNAMPKIVPDQPSEKGTSRSDNVPMVQSLATVPKEPEKATGSDSTSGKISKAVPESTGQNAMPKIVPDQPSEKVTKARSLFEVFICHYIYVSFLFMSSDEIETMYVCRSLP
jgi:hypothetical protein